MTALTIHTCQNDRDSWVRVYRTTVKGELVTNRFSELSWPLARRIVPALLLAHGITDQQGIFTPSGRLFVIEE